MNILILGASGFAGTWITSALLKGDHRIFCGVRDTERIQRLFPQAEIIYCDFLKDNSVSVWIPRLRTMDCVINCVGIFYHKNREIIWRLHYETAKAIFMAAKQAGVKQIIQLSALAVEQYDTDYAKSKKAAEDCLRSLNIPHIILRPSFIYGPGAQGGLALIRALAALPFVVFLPGTGEQQFQPIFVEDLAHAVKQLLEKEELEKSLTLAAVSPQPISLKRMLITLRYWLGLKEPFFISIPIALLRFISKLGNRLSNSLVNEDAIKMLEYGNISNESESIEFQRAIGFIPSNFKEATQLIPSGRQDFWYSRLFFLRPALRISLAFMWLASALTSGVLYPAHESYELLASVGITEFWQPLFLYGATFLNFLIGLSLLANYKTKINCLAQIVVMLIYSLIITVKLPYLWLEPFGPVVKNIPLFVSILMLYVMESN
ncbi:SDR family oxidoreductase [Legionella jordanis]|uniref:Oxidoreductase n=1 Tax=Legionella jordanis TaxID=456 RepID=A0A0W0V7D2_9GAMM|nr:SDR family oxidoreductase [Legionella jordanis]KTD16050.1 oxidoreductase [Legionella jordanis]RMX04717.1 SDR family oxidoreductase [Legionella jordanis]RMX18426.1 SDR family oxidoreductase [Legionella jordanis]VEH12491.1 oxidoreductase [Legionella jordanis]